MKYKNSLLLFISLFCWINLLQITIAFGQESPPGEGEEMTLEEFNEMAFGTLNPEHFPSGILYDRTEKFSQIPYLQGREDEIAIDFTSWVEVMEELKEAKTKYSNLELPEFDEAYWIRLLTYYEQVYAEGDMLTVPLGLIAVNYHEFKENAIEEGLIQIHEGLRYIENEDLEENPYEEKLLIAVAPLIGEFNAKRLRIIYDPEFMFTNIGEKPEAIYIQVEGEEEWIELRQFNSIVREVGSESTMKMKIQIEFEGGGGIGIGRTGNNRSQHKEGDQLKFDEVWDDIQAPRFHVASPYICNDLPVIGFCHTIAQADVGIYYSCPDKKIRKPFILVTGYDPAKFHSATSKETLDKKLNVYNEHGLIDYLHDGGFDVFLCKMRFGSDHMRNNAAVLQDLIERINTHKFLNGSQVENVLMGWSLGGLTASYTLAQMEKDYFSGASGINHHTKMYISSDGEHKGAAIPIGAQHSAFWPATKVLSMPTPQEILLYHFSQTGDPSNPGQGEHIDRTLYQGSLINLQHQHTTHMGFPSLTRNVGIAIGSRDASPFNFSGGDKLFSFEGNSKKKKRIEKYWATDANTLVYEKIKQRRLKQFLPWITIKTERFQTDGTALSLNNSPGSTHSFHKILGGAKLATNFLRRPRNVEIEFSFLDDCFVPSVSALGIEGATSSNSMLNERIDKLFYTSPTTQNNSFGYPHHSPFNQSLNTPFDAVAATDANDIHNPKKSLFPQLINFIQSEIMGDDLILQDRIIGAFQPQYAADFEARKTIQAAGNLNERFEKNEFAITASSNVRLFAQESIILGAGFEAHQGTEFLARIGQLCDSGLNEREGIVENNSKPKISEPENRSRLDELKKQQEIKVFPNPLSGAGHIAFELPADTKIQIAIRDIQGRQVQQIENGAIYHAGNHRINFMKKGLSPGLYFLEFETQNSRIIKKILIK